ncbi:MAG TPA: anion transporter [Verrucomicrobiae bacterium]|nr:anion transporter [Verrucomicrobiae bacterium]
MILTFAPVVSHWHIVVAWLIFLSSYLVFAVGRLPGTKIDRTAMAVIGAVAMFVFGALTPRDAIESIDFNTIVLLFSMMLIAASLHLAGFFEWIAHLVIEHLKPEQLLPGVVFTSGILSAFLVNDVVCVVMAPLVLDICKRMRVKPVPYLLALATASNIGSSATITGNPQNILIGSVSGISYRSFAAHLAPVALAGLFVDWALLHWIFLRGDSEGAQRLDPKAAKETREREIHPAWPLGVTVCVLLGFLWGYPPPLVAAAGGALVLVQRRRSPKAIYSDVDWSLLVLFVGLFLILGGAQQAGITRELLGAAERLNLHNPVIFAGMVTLLSNVASNVPTVMLLKNLVPQFHDARTAWLLLAMSSTLAGNLTITGSVANIIVVEKARTESHISFLNYMKIGVPVTLATLAIGLVWLSFARF